jgi:hypothetical protein
MVLLPLFIIFLSTLWGLWFYNENEFVVYYKFVCNLIEEKDYKFLLIHTCDKEYKKTFKERILLALGSFFILLTIFYDNETYKMFLYSIFTLITVYKIQYYLLKSKYSSILKKTNSEFPYYLNNLSILIQDNPVPVALNKSIENSPKVFKNDLEIMVNDIHEGNKTGIIPYIEFASKFKQVDDIFRIMRTVYNISITTNNRDVIITSLARISNEKVSNARRLRLESIIEKQSLVPWILFLWIGLVIINMFMSIDIGMLGG